MPSFSIKETHKRYVLIFCKLNKLFGGENTTCTFISEESCLHNVWMLLLSMFYVISGEVIVCQYSTNYR